MGDIYGDIHGEEIYTKGGIYKERTFLEERGITRRKDLR